MDEQLCQRVLRLPLSIQETGLATGMLTELALKYVYTAGEIGATQVCRQMCLPFVGVVQPILELLDREELVNIIGAGGFGEQAYRYTISRKGIERVYQNLERSQWMGPAPVPLERYNAMMRAQAVGEVFVFLAVRQGLLDDGLSRGRHGPLAFVGSEITARRAVFASCDVDMKPVLRRK